MVIKKNMGTLYILYSSVTLNKQNTQNTVFFSRTDIIIFYWYILPCYIVFFSKTESPYFDWFDGSW